MHLRKMSARGHFWGFKGSTFAPVLLSFVVIVMAVSLLLKVKLLTTHTNLFILYTVKVKKVFLKYMLNYTGQNCYNNVIIEQGKKDSSKEIMASCWRPTWLWWGKNDANLVGGVWICNGSLWSNLKWSAFSDLLVFYYYITCLPHPNHTHADTHTLDILLRGQYSILLRGFQVHYSHPLLNHPLLASSLFLLHKVRC